MKIEQILSKVLDVMEKCDIHSFPIDCHDIIHQYGFQIVRYSDLAPKKQNACMLLSEDACTIESTIYYNDTQVGARIRFSIMHEFGHYILESDNEAEANKFASNILAPRMAIHYAGCKNHVDVAKKFGISYEAAELAFNDYRKWHRLAAYRMSMLDKELYQHFFDEKLKKFIWNIDECIYCHEPIYNAPRIHVCPLCNLRYFSPKYTYDPLNDPLSLESRLLNS